jgi:hypothetical protein
MAAAKPFPDYCPMETDGWQPPATICAARLSIAQEKRVPHCTTRLQAVAVLVLHRIPRAEWAFGPIERFRTIWSVAKVQFDIVAAKHGGKSRIDCHKDIALICRTNIAVPTKRNDGPPDSGCVDHGLHHAASNPVCANRPMN